MAQLNFAIPDQLLERIDTAKPQYLDRKGFLCLLLEQALEATDKKGLAVNIAKPSR
jgi:hypothetical protein